MKRIGILLTCSFLILSCQRLKPAGFWRGYEEEFLEENRWDVGPWGGFAAMHWVAKNGSTFSMTDISHFAAQHGWVLVDTIAISGKSMAGWVSSSKPVFPFAYTYFSDPKNLSFVFPRWIHSDAVIYRFKTDWIAVQPGNAKETNINGYVLLSANKKQFSVYHLWGE